MAQKHMLISQDLADAISIAAPQESAVAVTTAIAVTKSLIRAMRRHRNRTSMNNNGNTFSVFRDTRCTLIPKQCLKEGP